MTITMIRTKTVEERVAFGYRCLQMYSEYLGELPPGEDTERSIDLSTLNMADDERCALAQSIGGLYYIGLRRLWGFLGTYHPEMIESWGDREDFAIAAGFTDHMVDDTINGRYVPEAAFRILEDAWVALLQSEAA